MNVSSPVPAAPPSLPFRSISETIALVGIGKTSLYGEIRAGRLRTVLVGRRRMVPADALAEWLASLPPGGPREIAANRARRRAS